MTTTFVRWVAVAAMAGSAVMAAAGVQAASYTTGFEAPTYSVGPVSGQDGWFYGAPTGWGQVQGAVVHGGGQALAFDGTQIDNLAQNWHGVSFTAGGPEGNVLRISLWGYVTESDPEVFWEVMGVLGDKGYLDQITMGDGLVAFANTFVPVAAATWNEFAMVLDLTAQSATAYLNDVEIGTEPFFSSGTTSVTMLGVGVSGYRGVPGTSQFYIDDLTIGAPVPEPVTMGVLALGLAGLGVARRRRG